MLWPWIGELKRDQLRKAAAEVGRSVPTDGPNGWIDSERSAWAAGFFDGEGSVLVADDPRRPAVTMSIPQASVSGVPDVLERFRAIVGAGTITGPRILRSPWSKLPQYRWQLSSFAEIERVVAMLYPYADVVKREQMITRLELVRAARMRRRSSVLPSPPR
ncbi:MAG: hypothetical protein M3P16_08665 [Chloroflexota bacterium]|nr:hypothetical protein [Chloroflexota bacterium]